MRRSDSDIRQDVSRELEWDTRVDAGDIGVAVSMGIVTLTGLVSSWGKKVAAQQAAHRVSGVLDVANDITVKIPGASGRSDTDIARAVREALEWDVFVPETQVRSTVSAGWVTLEGDVDNFSQRQDAERAIRNLAGVRGVTNKIEIAVPTASAADVKRSLEEALERQAEREATRIAVDVEDGTVSLSGIVHSWPERRAVVGAARGTLGVKKVVDQLRIEPYGS